MSFLVKKNFKLFVNLTLTFVLSVTIVLLVFRVQSSLHQVKVFVNYRNLTKFYCYR